jgi:hypothetical protein
VNAKAVDGSGRRESLNTEDIFRTKQYAKRADKTTRPAGFNAGYGWLKVIG